MIREYSVKDKEQLEKIIKQETKIEKEEIDFITDCSNRIVVFEDEQAEIQGFSTFRLWGNKQADLYTYVAPNSRSKGIGTRLYQEMSKNIDDFNLEFISTRIEADIDNTISLYKKMGYEKWYIEYVLSYHGSKQPQSDLEFITYEDKYFEQYGNGLRNSFYKLRKSNDFQPYYCCELSEEKRKEFLDQKENIYLLLNKGTLVSSVIVNKQGHIDDMFVLSSDQGKGYGRKTMQYAMNKVMEQGNSHIYLTAIDWNKRALNLYQSLGFDIVQTTYYYRLFV